MLVLSRHKDESVIVTVPAGFYKADQRITVTVVDVENRTRLGIDAPIEFPVHRNEVQNAIDRENAAVACSGGNRGSGASQCAAEDGRM